MKVYYSPIVRNRVIIELTQQDIEMVIQDNPIAAESKLVGSEELAIIYRKPKAKLVAANVTDLRYLDFCH